MQTLLSLAPDDVRLPHAERLPIAFVYLDRDLLGHCMNQLIRQTTKHDSAGLADCYAFGVRSMNRLRSDPNRAEIVKLHLMAAARLKWAPATISRADNWVQCRPFDSAAIYRRPICISRLVTPGD